MTGEMPKGEMDHIDRVRSNNRWSNVGLSSQNKINRGPRSNTGIKGVYRHRDYDLFEARIGIEGRIINLGIYRDIEAERLHV